jgi:MFS family permease
VLTYGTQALGLSRGELLRDVLISSFISLVTVPLFGHLSDLVGRKRLYLIGAAIMGLFIFPYFALLDSKEPLLVLIAIALSVPVHDIQYGPQAAFIAESFTPRLRYSGASLGYQLASVTAGGPAPIVALWLFATYKTSLAIAVYIAVCVVISFVSALLLRERAADDVSAEYDLPGSRST